MTWQTLETFESLYSVRSFHSIFLVTRIQSSSGDFQKNTNMMTHQLKKSVLCRNTNQQIVRADAHRIWSDKCFSHIFDHGTHQ